MNELSQIEHVHPNFITSGERTAKMMAIMLGICIAGGAIFFGMWDYWTSAPPAAAGAQAETTEHDVQAAFTGVHIPVSLSFIESSDFRTLAFNALPGEPNHNPTIRANVGDEINFDVINNGISFHSFGVTTAEEGNSGVIPGTDIASPTNPLKPGDMGQSSFIPGKDGIYYYICTVPGHRAQGMVGQIIVGDVSEIESSSSMPAPGSESVPEMIIESEPEVTEEPEPEPEVMEEPVMMEPFSGIISIAPGSSSPPASLTTSQPKWSDGGCWKPPGILSGKHFHFLAAASKPRLQHWLWGTLGVPARVSIMLQKMKLTAPVPVFLKRQLCFTSPVFLLTVRHFLTVTFGSLNFGLGLLLAMFPVPSSLVVLVQRVDVWAHAEGSTASSAPARTRVLTIPRFMHRIDLSSKDEIEFLPRPVRRRGPLGPRMSLR